MEIAMDKMEGIAEDGGELTDNLAREARVRSAYLDWCKQYGKSPDESRYPTFESNFLAMEEYAKESGKAMNLNKYADCTEEEYAATMAEKTSKKESEAKKKEEAEAKKKEAAAAKAKAQAEARAKAEGESDVLLFSLPPMPARQSIHSNLIYFH
jgi:hypothetical protein